MTITIPADNSKDTYSFRYISLGSDGTLYLKAGETMSAAEFSSKTKLDFDYAESTVFYKYTEEDETAAHGLAELALLMTKDTLAASGTGFAWSDLGFAGY